MKIKFLVIVAIIIIITEIVFSFYYSTSTISLNQKYGQNLQELSTQKIKNEQLKINYASASSLKNIQNFVQEKQLIPIQNHYEY